MTQQQVHVTTFARRRGRSAMARWVLLCLALSMFSIGPALGQGPPKPAPLGSQPPPPSSADVDEKLGQQIPLDLTFTDEQGRTVQLGDFFDGRRPVVLQIGYYNCPQLCTIILNGMTDALRELDRAPGDRYMVVCVSIDPSETPELARLKKEAYLSLLGKPDAAGGWYFLTGEEDQIEKLAASVGYVYEYMPNVGEYQHPAVLVIASPDGMISRYLYGLVYDSRTLWLSLAEAGEGRTMTTLERLILTCFRFDPDTGQYTWQALRLMQIGAVLTLLTLGGIIGGFVLRANKRKRGIRH